MPTSARSITAADRIAAQRLKRIWNARKRDLNLTQEKAAAQLNMTQGAVAQYLNGHTAIGTEALLKFSRLLGVQPVDIRPEFQYGSLAPADLPPDVVEMAVKIATLPEAARRDVLGYLNVIMQNHRYVDWVEKADAKAKSQRNTAPLTAKN